MSDVMTTWARTQISKANHGMANYQGAIEELESSQDELLERLRQLEAENANLRLQRDNARHSDDNKAAWLLELDRYSRRNVFMNVRERQFEICEELFGHFIHPKSDEARLMDDDIKRKLNLISVAEAEWACLYVVLKAHTMDFLISDNASFQHNQLCPQLMECKTGQYPIELMKASALVYNIEKHLRKFGNAAPEGSMKKKYINNRMMYWQANAEYSEDDATLPMFQPSETEVYLSPFDLKYASAGVRLNGDQFDASQVMHPLNRNLFDQEVLGLTRSHFYI